MPLSTRHARRGRCTNPSSPPLPTASPYDRGQDSPAVRTWTSLISLPPRQALQSGTVESADYCSLVEAHILTSSVAQGPKPGAIGPGAPGAMRRGSRLRPSAVAVLQEAARSRGGVVRVEGQIAQPPYSDDSKPPSAVAGCAVLGVPPCKAPRSREKALGRKRCSESVGEGGAD